jgi:hypothetical protein
MLLTRRAAGRMLGPNSRDSWPYWLKNEPACFEFERLNADEDWNCMITPVPYLDEETIERDAMSLLAEFAGQRGGVIALPIPIEEIAEKYLKLRLEFDDLHRLFGLPRAAARNPDILGVIFFDDARIVLDESLDPEEHPATEGRYRFTLAHEAGGHWRLHRHLFAKEPKQVALFEMSNTPSILCRSSQAEERVEWQANYYASCLLMPRKFVFAAWGKMFPDGKQRVLQPRTPINHPCVEIRHGSCWISRLQCSETDDHALDRIARPLAEKFLVSPIAMRIRLERLGLLLREVPRQRIIAAGS